MNLLLSYLQLTTYECECKCHCQLRVLLQILVTWDGTEVWEIYKHLAKKNKKANNSK